MSADDGFTELQTATATGDAAAIIGSTERLALAATAPGEIAPSVIRSVVPGDFAEYVRDLETYQPHPRRKRGAVTLNTTASLAQYVNEHSTPGTTVYAEPDTLTAVAVIDDHSTADPGHGEHRATLTLRRTIGCARWFAAHGKYMDQEAFAQLIEDGLTEIADPPGADLLELAQTMQATTGATFRSALRLASGQVQFSYVEEIAATAGPQGDMAIPSTITLVFAPFYGASPVQIEARLRYRLLAGTLKLGVWLIRHVEAEQDAFATELASLTDLTSGGTTGQGLVALYGTPS